MKQWLKAQWLRKRIAWAIADADYAERQAAVFRAFAQEMRVQLALVEASCETSTQHS
jgi:hypothetical protein